MCRCDGILEIQKDFSTVLVTFWHSLDEKNCYADFQRDSSFKEDFKSFKYPQKI